MGKGMAWHALPAPFACSLHPVSTLQVVQQALCNFDGDWLTFSRSVAVGGFPDRQDGVPAPTTCALWSIGSFWRPQIFATHD